MSLLLQPLTNAQWTRRCASKDPVLLQACWMVAQLTAIQQQQTVWTQKLVITVRTLNLNGQVSTALK